MASEGEDLPLGKVLPLNSKRLKAAYVKALAEELNVPTSASTEETRALIEGTLEELDREPRNVQVIVQGLEDGGTCLYLADQDGVFCQTRAGDERPPTKEHPQSTERGDEGSGDEHWANQLESASEALAKSQERVRRLEQEITAVHSQAEQTEKHLRSELARATQAVERGKERLKQVWKLNCEQVAEYEELLGAKDAELERLRGLLARSEGAGRTLMGRGRLRGGPGRSWRRRRRATKWPQTGKGSTCRSLYRGGARYPVG